MSSLVLRAGIDFEALPPALLAAAVRPRWFACATCPADDRVWPVAAFAGWLTCAASGYKIRKTPICDACLYDRYPRVFKPCRTCGGIMHSRPGRDRNPFPRCNACERDQVPACRRCREDLTHRGSIDGYCPRCHGLGLTVQPSRDPLSAAWICALGARLEVAA